MLPKLLLLDADIVISAYELGVWENLTKITKVYLPSTVIRKREANYYIDKNGDRRYIEDLMVQIQKGIIFEAAASALQLLEIEKLLDASAKTSLSAADKESLAIMISTKKNFIFCTGDKQIIKKLVSLNLKEKSVSMETLLKSCGVGRTVPYERSEKYFKMWLEKGAVDFVTQGKPPKYKKGMPNRNTHLTISALSGLGISLLVAYIKNEKISFGEVAASTFGGILGGLIPDKIDLPVHPNHRSIGHGAIPVGFGIYKTIEVTKGDGLPSWLRYALYGFIAGYATHLLTDATTPKSIPILY